MFKPTADMSKLSSTLSLCNLSYSSKDSFFVFMLLVLSPINYKWVAPIEEEIAASFRLEAYDASCVIKMKRERDNTTPFIISNHNSTKFEAQEIRVEGMLPINM